MPEKGGLDEDGAVDFTHVYQCNDFTQKVLNLQEVSDPKLTRKKKSGRAT